MCLQLGVSVDTPPASDGRPTVELRVGGKKTRFFVINFQNIEKTMETVETLETAAENHSSNSLHNPPAVSIGKNSLETVETNQRENAEYSDCLPDPEEEEEDADALTEF